MCVADRPMRAPLLYWSLVAQSRDNWELLLLDQSEDGRAGAFIGLGATQVRVPRHGDWGQTEKERAARELATGDVLLFPPDDAYYVPSALARITTAMADADLVLFGWLYGGQGYRPMPPVPAVGHVDVGGFAVRRSTFLAHGWPSKAQTGDGELVVSLAQTPGVRLALVPDILYVQN